MNDKINQIICFDVETGGLDRKTNKHALKVPITQFALHTFRADTYDVLSEFETFVQPYDNLEYQAEALKFTGITMTDINSGCTVHELVDKLCDEFTKATTGHKRFHKPILLGHNVGYDIQFLQYAFSHCRKDLSKYLHGSFDGVGNFQPLYMDTMTLARALWVHENDGKKFTLEACCERAGVELVAAHSALPDVRATVALYQHIVDRGRNGTTVVADKQAEKSRFTFKF